MKIVILSDSDSGGGAAIAAFRFHLMLRKNGIDSFLIVRQKNTLDKYVIAPSFLIDIVLSRLSIYINRIFTKFFTRNKHTLFTYNFFSLWWIKHTIKKINPDIVNIHWISENLLSYKDILNMNRPVIFTLHDMNLFTGGCHYNNHCENFLFECKNCPIIWKDNLFRIASHLQQKKIVYLSQISNLLVLGPSKWICSEAKKSYILQNINVANLPNPIDVNKFSPSLTLKAGKKKILFGAINSLDDRRKGLKYLSDALSQLDSKIYDLEIFGNKNNYIEENIKKFKINFHGHLNNENEVIKLYRKCDVFVVPSIQENFSNAILESLSCGLPVVCFDIGGNSDMVIDRFNGYLAKPYESTDIANGISWCVNNYNFLSVNATKFVIDNFSENLICNRFLEILNENDFPSK